MADSCDFFFKKFLLYTDNYSNEVAKMQNVGLFLF